MASACGLVLLKIFMAIFSIEHSFFVALLICHDSNRIFVSKVDFYKRLVLVLAFCLANCFQTAKRSTKPALHRLLVKPFTT